MDRVIRLVGSSVIEEDKVHAMVAPMLFDKEHALAGVNMEFNAIFLTSDMLGDTMFYGQGAGKLPTASAVVSDVMEAVQFPHAVKRLVWSADKMPVADLGEEKRRFFARIHGDKALVTEMEKELGSLWVIKVEGLSGELGIVTGEVSEADFMMCRQKHPEIMSAIRLAE